MNIRKNFALPLLALCIMALVGCGPTFLSNCEEKAKAQKWSNDQVNDACESGANRYYFLREVDGELIVRYDLLKWPDLRKESDKLIESLNEQLNPLNDLNQRDMHAFDGQEDYYKRERHIEQVRRQVYRDAELHKLFNDFMGKSSDYMSGTGYSIKKIALPQKLTETFPFSDDNINSAKKNGTLTQVDEFSWARKTRYFRKAPDPLHPDDPNEFVWKPWGPQLGEPVTLGLEFTAWKIVTNTKPRDNKSDYVEGYLTVNGKREANPVIQVFFPSGGMAIVVTYAREKNLGIVNLPNFVDQMMVSSLTEIGQNPAILAKIFPERPDEDRVRPVKPPIKIEIAHVGDTLELWEKAPTAEGWKVEYDYRNDRKDNFSVAVGYKKMHHDPDEKMPEFRDVEYIAKIWTDPRGDVTEYYRPKPPYNGKFKANAYGTTVSFTSESGDRVEGTITNGAGNKFVEDAPYAIVYSPDGGKEDSKWWRIEKDKGSTVFNKRKEVSKPRNGEDDDGEDEGHDHSFGIIPPFMEPDFTMKRDRQGQSSATPALKSKDPLEP